jgi:hypothetical protein
MTAMRINTHVAADRKRDIIAVLRMTSDNLFWGVIEGLGIDT